MTYIARDLEPKAPGREDKLEGKVILNRKDWRQVATKVAEGMVLCSSPNLLLCQYRARLSLHRSDRTRSLKSATCRSGA